MVQAKERADREARRATESTRISDFFMIVSDMIRGTSVLVKSYLPANVPLFSILYGMYTHSLSHKAVMDDVARETTRRSRVTVILRECELTKCLKTVPGE